MNKVSLENLPLNSYIDAPVFLDDGYILLAPDIPVSKELLKRLEKWQFRQIFTDGQPQEKPAGKASRTLSMMVALVPSRVATMTSTAGSPW